MSGLSIYSANQFLNWIGGTDTDTAPAAVYVALFNGDPTDDGSGGTEVTTDVASGGRLAVTFDAPDGKELVSNADVNFGASENDVDITHAAIFDDPTAGNMIGSMELSPSQSIITGDPVKFLSGQVIIDLTTP